MMDVRGDKKGADTVNPLLGTFELSLFMAAGVKRFPDTDMPAKLSFAIPLILMLIWVYPFSVVPTELMGARSYANLVLIHGLIVISSIVVSCSVLWAVVKKLEKRDRFWPVVMMINFCSLTAFALTLPLLLSVMSGAHTWHEIYGGLILITYYQLAIVGYAITRGMSVPWQFGAGLSFLFLFVDQAATKTVFSLAGIQ